MEPSRTFVKISKIKGAVGTGPHSSTDGPMNLIKSKAGACAVNHSSTHWRTGAE